MWLTFSFNQMSYSNTESVRVALNRHQKFHKAKELALKLASLVSEGGMAVFEERFSLLQLLKSKWLNGEHPALSTCSIHIIIVVCF